MALRIESRPVGDVLVVQCHGRIVNGSEVHALHAYFGDTRAKYADIVMQLDKVEFIDSSGLGALVRLMHTSRAKHGDLKLCGVAESIRKVLQMTNLMSLFEVYDSAEEAITAAYLGSRYSKGKVGDTRTRVLCLIDSGDVRALMREVLFSAGFNAVVTAKIEDAKILLKAMKAKTVVLSAQAQSGDHRTPQQVLREIDPAITFVVLDENFASQDPGEAMEKLLASLSTA
ncbi:MAG TPA: STAS domain-containing protein [Candidatus Bathyarchaeia archaeon]|nr:STAS domain-containing protein [Candidatus Bathyarchaeia archaeon]